MSTTTTCVTSLSCDTSTTKSNTTNNTTASTPGTTATTTGTSSTSPAIAFNPEQLKILRQYSDDNRKRVGSWFKSTPSSPNPDTAKFTIPLIAHPDTAQHSTLAQPKRPRKRPSWFEELSTKSTKAPHKDIKSWHLLGYAQAGLSGYEDLTKHRCGDMARFGGLISDAMNEIGATPTFERFSSAVTMVGAAPRIPEKMAEAASHLLPKADTDPRQQDLLKKLTELFEKELKHPQDVSLTKDGLTLEESTKVVTDGENRYLMPDLETDNAHFLSTAHLALIIGGTVPGTPWADAIDAGYKGSNWELLNDNVPGADIEEEICRRHGAGETIPEGIPQSLKDAAEAKRASSSHVPTRTSSNETKTDSKTSPPSWTSMFTGLPNPVSHDPASESVKGASGAMERVKRLLDRGTGEKSSVARCAESLLSFP